MTSGELKFALAVETVLNWIPHPEYRQLIVETLMIFAMYAERQISPGAHGIITIEDFVHKANDLFLQDQVRSFINIFPIPRLSSPPMILLFFLNLFPFFFFFIKIIVIKLD